MWLLGSVFALWYLWTRNFHSVEILKKFGKNSTFVLSELRSLIRKKFVHTEEWRSRGRKSEIKLTKRVESLLLYDLLVKNSTKGHTIFSSRTLAI